MESYFEKFGPKVWDRVFGHPLGQEPTGGIEPAVFRRLDAAHPEDKPRVVKSWKDYDQTAAEREQAEKRKATMERLMGNKPLTPVDGKEQRFVDEHIRSLGGFFIAKFRCSGGSFKNYSPNRALLADWLLRKGKEAGVI